MQGLLPPHSETSSVSVALMMAFAVGGTAGEVDLGQADRIFREHPALVGVAEAERTHVYQGLQ